MFHIRQRVKIYRSNCTLYLFFDWLKEITWKIVDSYYQLNGRAAYQLDQDSGQIYPGSN